MNVKHCDFCNLPIILFTKGSSCNIQGICKFCLQKNENIIDFEYINYFKNQSIYYNGIDIFYKEIYNIYFTQLITFTYIFDHNITLMYYYNSTSNTEEIIEFKFIIPLSKLNKYLIIL